MKSYDALIEQLTHYCNEVYTADMLARQDLDSPQALAQALVNAVGISATSCASPIPHQNHWDERRSILITYADSVIDEECAPLETLHEFVTQFCADSLSDIHLLPFYPYSSDDGFAVIDYSSVNPAHGTWRDIHALAKHKNLMFDLVINHCSARSQWFLEFCDSSGKGQHMFYTAEPDTDVSCVTRPRTSPLLRPTRTAEGKKLVWCTFSHDQVDFDFSHPLVLLEFAQIIGFYIRNGATLFRLDAVAFLWKELGTSCINHPHTHTIIKIYRLLIEHLKPNAIVITETNIPNHENLLYFGNANEAHAIYNFALPPLLLHTLMSGDSTAITRWQMGMPPAQNGTTYFNFIASHDGIGLRPTEGLLDDALREAMIQTCQSQGAKISWRTLPDGSQSAYEINVALYSACRATHAGVDQWQTERFLCAHTIMLGLEGIPGVYIHSLVGTENDVERVKHSGQNRCINRHKWSYQSLQKALHTPQTHHAVVFSNMTKLIQLRAKQRAFHPNAIQFTLQLGPSCFGFWRQSLDRSQSIFCISNVTNTQQSLHIQDINLVQTQRWHDLISGVWLKENQTTLTLTPYQTVWISNTHPS
jgi:sucrose phosphorylase